MNDTTELIKKLACWMGWEAPAKGQYWKYAGKPDGIDYFTGYMQPDAKQGKIWNPLTRIRDAWPLVERVKENGYEFEIGYDLFEKRWWMRIGSLFGIAETAPVAICMAIEKLIGRKELQGIPFNIAADREPTLDHRPDFSQR